jgi:hypothetical protein
MEVVVVVVVIVRPSLSPIDVSTVDIGELVFVISAFGGDILFVWWDATKRQR